MKILAIHGAWSSSISFNYIKSKTKSRNWKTIDYHHEFDSWSDIINKSTNHIHEPYIAIGHSLGGMIALHSAKDPYCKGIITVASPLAGLDLNLIQQYLARSTLLSKITKNSKEICEIHNFDYKVPVLHLIATVGYNPFIYEHNDGVLPLKVQTGWTCGEIAEIPVNHYEILQSDATVSAIQTFIKSV